MFFYFWWRKGVKGPTANLKSTLKLLSFHWRMQDEGVDGKVFNLTLTVGAWSVYQASQQPLEDTKTFRI